MGDCDNSLPFHVQTSDGVDSINELNFVFVEDSYETVDRATVGVLYRKATANQ